jgi:hypothetical protein
MHNLPICAEVNSAFLLAYPLDLVPGVNIFSEIDPDWLQEIDIQSDVPSSDCSIFNTQLIRIRPQMAFCNSANKQSKLIARHIQHIYATTGSLYIYVCVCVFVCMCVET